MYSLAIDLATICHRFAVILMCEDGEGEACHLIFIRGMAKLFPALQLPRLVLDAITKPNQMYSTDVHHSMACPKQKRPSYVIGHSEKSHLNKSPESVR